MGSHDSLAGLKVLENVGMDAEGLGEQPASKPLLPDTKGFLLLGAPHGVLGNFLFIMIITRHFRTRKYPTHK